MTHADKARDLFLEGYSCSQAVLGAYAEELGLDRDTAMKLSAPFGGGVGRLREMCGACSGMLMAFGMLYGYDIPDNSKIKAAHYADTRELCEKFKERQGSYICREILGKRAEIGGNPSARTEEFYKTRPCVSCVIDAAEILDEYIDTHPKKQEKQRNTYLFDFDGTLVDSMPMYTKIFLGILDDEGVSYSDDIINIITPLGTQATVEYMIELGVKMTAQELLSDMKNRLLREYSQNIYVKNNVTETLKKLKSSGASLNIVTACFHPSIELCLEHNGIYSLFDNVWSCDDFKTTKTDPELYHLVAKRMGVSVSDVIFADDNLGACQTAKKAGMLTCGVYDESSKDLVDIIKAECDFYVHDFSEILKPNV